MSEDNFGVMRISRAEVESVAQRFCIDLADWVMLLQIYGTAERLVAYLEYRARELAPGGRRAPFVNVAVLEERNSADPRVVRATHGELAQLLGSSREKVTAAIGKLKKLGWVSVGRGYVEWLRK